MYIQKIFEDREIGKEYEIKGWVYRIRKMKDKVFIVMRDSYGIIQIVFDATSPACTVNTTNRPAKTIDFTNYTNTITK